MQPVIYYQTDGYVTDGGKLMGRQAAGEGFLRAAARSGAQRLVCQTSGPDSAKHFAAQLNQLGFRGQTAWISTADPQAIAAEGCLYTPGPDLVEHAWRRKHIGDKSFSICGITHTTASHLAMTYITGMLTAPVHEWDALICTSNAVRDTVNFLLQRQADYLTSRLGASRFKLPQLPIIPLGVHCDDFQFSTEDRDKARAALNIDEDEVVALFVGRLSFHAKAHPLQMYTALERAAKGKRVRLIQCGWFANQPIDAAFKDAGAALCPSIKLDFIDGREAANRKNAWAAADIFFSLADNIQETFGLTPIEAMAAGLPLIVTDWDGYKDTVRDGVDGFRITTLMPPAPLGSGLALRHEFGIDSYDMYCGFASQLVAVDPVALEDACTRLIGDASLRRRMGEAGRKRARELYDWQVIYRQYQDLWSELNSKRAQAQSSNEIRPASRPDRPDPFAAFAAYPTARLSDHHVVKLLATDELAQRRKMAINNFSAPIQLGDQDCGTIFQLLSQHGSRTVAEILSAFPAERRADIARGLLWLAKLEAVHISFAPSN